ncbi:conserved exported protein of unknown function [Magnetospirillum sp. XM-1]|uniref:hypothetical protein n=1 Tax=Magnetospirillum sp. XM-1 TaxID=1663591 RepID=UPI00073DD5D4|nr:hypothetical protein [Magnetospirillum sp. XM-1]CUW38990.1 conserved exported protein of unknown function [Magnetospirillum sp. XM-1]
MDRNRILSAALAAAGLSVLSAFPVLAGDSKAQVTTAAAHAGMAATAAELKMVKGHLQHVINCLVGPAGEGYDAAQANPCKDQGFGAIPDAPMDKMPALKIAKDGAAESDLAKAQEKAAATQVALGKISM